MKVSKPTLGVLLVAVTAVSFLAAPAMLASSSNDLNPPMISWTPPATWSPSRTGMHPMSGEIGAGPFAFFPVTNCRQYDSRNTSPLASGVNRTVTLTGAPCGVPAGSLAIAVNITIFNIIGAGSNGVFKVDTVTPPVTAWINYPPTETQRGNAGVVPLTGGGAIIVQAAQGAGQIDFTVDVFGYYYNGNSNIMPTGDYFAMRGSVTGGLIYGENEGPSNAPGYGVRGVTFSTGANSSGVYGESDTTSGSFYGVTGKTFSAIGFTAGVRGIAGSGEPPGASGCCSDIGVLGESNTGTAVAGISQSLAGFFDLKDSGGSIIAGGFAGFKGAANYAFYASPGDFGGTGAKYFIEPHPTEASKIIRYVSLEGPESGTYFRGTAQTSHGTAVIAVPEDFRFVTDDDGLTVQLTPVGAAATMYVVSQDLNQIVVRASRDVKFHYMVNGVRRAFKDHQPIVEGPEFMPRGPEEVMPAGFRPEIKQRLIANGTYNPDGTVNMRTAERMGWTKVWADRAAEAQASAAKARALSAGVNPKQ